MTTAIVLLVSHSITACLAYLIASALTAASREDRCRECVPSLHTIQSIAEQYDLPISTVRYRVRDLTPVKTIGRHKFYAVNDVQKCVLE